MPREQRRAILAVARIPQSPGAIGLANSPERRRSDFSEEIETFADSLSRSLAERFARRSVRAVLFTRVEIYEGVWAVPAARLAKQIGVSDTAIRNACERHAIPRPGVGYWARLAAGQQLDRPPLPPAEPDTPSEIAFYPPRST
jgi:hypothetical protein